MRKALLIAGVVIALGASAATATGALAAKKTDGTRPGWGFGDKNHVHTGPPGQSVRVAR